MRARGLALMLPLLGCAHAPGNVSSPASASEHPVAAPASVPEATGPATRQPVDQPALHELRWQLRSGDTGSWSEAPSALHTFTLGRWECALSEVQSDDMLGPRDLELRRSRRLACTHATGATVQTELACTLHATLAAGSDDSASARRVLPIRLDTSPTLYLQCEPSPVAQLALVTRSKQQLTSLCAQPGGLVACPAATSAH